VDRGEVNERVALPRPAGHEDAEHLERVGLVELVACVPGLRVDVDAHDVEARSLEAAGAPAGAAEAVEQPRSRHAALSGT
jgi:hypothetical protein